MKTHDIISEPDGWAYFVNGLQVASYPSWHMAINAARAAAEIDVMEGEPAALRFQGVDGKMRQIQTRTHGAKPTVPHLVVQQPVGSAKESAERQSI
jgi:hypothetical protein